MCYLSSRHADPTKPSSYDLPHLVHARSVQHIGIGNVVVPVNTNNFSEASEIEFIQRFQLFSVEVLGFTALYMFDNDNCFVNCGLSMEIDDLYVPQTIP